MRLRSLGTKLLITLITTHLKMILLVCDLGGESTVIYFPISLRLPDLSSPSLLSAASERDFSSADDIQERTSQLKPSTVDDVLFCTASKAPRQTPVQFPGVPSYVSNFPSVGVCNQYQYIVYSSGSGCLQMSVEL